MLASVKATDAGVLIRGNWMLPVAPVITVVPTCSITAGARRASMAPGTLVGTKPSPAPWPCAKKLSAPAAARSRAMLGMPMFELTDKPVAACSALRSCIHSASAPL